METSCKSCDSKLTIPEEMLGKRLLCPKCNDPIDTSEIEVIAECQYCWTEYEVVADYLGRRLKCTECNKITKLLIKSPRVQVACSFCEQGFEVPQKMLGWLTKCPHCSRQTRVLEPSQAAFVNRNQEQEYMVVEDKSQLKKGQIEVYEEMAPEAKGLNKPQGKRLSTGKQVFRNQPVMNPRPVIQKSLGSAPTEQPPAPAAGQPQTPVGKTPTPGAKRPPNPQEVRAPLQKNDVKPEPIRIGDSEIFIVKEEESEVRRSPQGHQQTRAYKSPDHSTENQLARIESLVEPEQIVDELPPQQKATPARFSQELYDAVDLQDEPTGHPKQPSSEEILDPVDLDHGPAEHSTNDKFVKRKDSKVKNLATQIVAGAIGLALTVTLGYLVFSYLDRSQGDGVEKPKSQIDYSVIEGETSSDTLTSGDGLSE